MRVQIELTPAFQKAFPTRSLSLEIPGDKATLRGLLQHLAWQGGKEVKALLFEKEGGRVLSGLMVMLNDRTFSGEALNVQDVALQEGDRVSLLYFVSGG